VTHDQEEALSMSHPIVVMNDGRIEQIGTPFAIYNSPRTRFVPFSLAPLNILRGRVLEPDSGRIAIDGQEIHAPLGIRGAQSGDARSVALRPEAVSLNNTGGDRNSVQGVIEEVSFLGAIVRIRVRLKENTISLDTFNNPSSPPPNRGPPAIVGFASEGVLVLEERS
jgi:putative spermidine/putrescine transport system ATP-binding protein